MLNFSDTLFKLYEETQNTEIYGLRSYEDGRFGIGFRRECIGSNKKDPIIDGNAFMLAATAFNTFPTPLRIDSIPELLGTPIDHIRIDLRAQYTFPLCQIDLGSFYVTAKDIVENDEFGPSMVKLVIARKN